MAQGGCIVQQILAHEGHKEGTSTFLLQYVKRFSLSIVHLLFRNRPLFVTVFFKCLPTASLALFVCLTGISWHKRHSFSRRILAGLICSCIGDALILRGLFPGMAAFGITHIFYISAFGLHLHNRKIEPNELILYGLNGISLLIVLHSLRNSPLKLRIGVPIYSILLTTMAWRATTRYLYPSSETLRGWKRSTFCSYLGGPIFVLSDIFLGLDRFVVTIPYAEVFIMTTYYIAQLCMTLSVVPDLNEESSSNEDTNMSTLSQNQEVD